MLCNTRSWLFSQTTQFFFLYKCFAFDWDNSYRGKQTSTNSHGSILQTLNLFFVPPASDVGTLLVEIIVCEDTEPLWDQSEYNGITGCGVSVEMCVILLRFWHSDFLNILFICSGKAIYSKHLSIFSKRLFNLEIRSSKQVIKMYLEEATLACVWIWYDVFAEKKVYKLQTMIHRKNEPLLIPTTSVSKAMFCWGIDTCSLEQPGWKKK